jgi:hypothetical protein
MGPGDHTAIMEREKKRTKKKQTLFKATKQAKVDKKYARK